MEKVRPWCGQPSDRGRLKNRTELNIATEYNGGPALYVHVYFSDVENVVDEVQPINTACLCS